jgi:hypothetical protein
MILLSLDRSYTAACPEHCEKPVIHECIGMIVGARPPDTSLH